MNIDLSNPPYAVTPKMDSLTKTIAGWLSFIENLMLWARK